MSFLDDAFYGHETVSNEHGLNMWRRTSAHAQYLSRSSGGINTRNEHYGSLSPGSTSSGLVPRSMSMIGSSAADESLCYRSDWTRTSSKTSTDKILPSTMQPIAAQVCQPLIYSELYQLHSCNFPNDPLGVPSLGHVQGDQPIQMSMPMQMQNVVWSIQQYQLIPFVMRPVPYPLESHHKDHYTWSEVSNSVSTPVFNMFSVSDYGNSYGYKTANCPISHIDVPPALELNKNKLLVKPIPGMMSCNISLPPAREKAPSDHSSMFTMSVGSAMNESKTSPNSEQTKKVIVSLQGNKNLWPGNLTYAECTKGRRSNLFITWTGTSTELVGKLRNFNLDVRDVFNTSDENILNVIFETHPTARKAFTMQHQIRLRIVPPKNSHRMWLRNPSPTFVVKYETKCQQVVRKGKAECHEIVGEVLKGCLISADQLKGHRIRILSCEGGFMLPGGKVVEMKGVQKSGEEGSIGWISYRCKHSKEPLLIRRSLNLLEDYIYNE